MEWVKLDLESRKVIKRVTGKPPLQFELTRHRTKMGNDVDRLKGMESGLAERHEM